MQLFPFAQLLWDAERRGVDATWRSECVTSCQIVDSLLRGRVAPKTLVAKHGVEPPIVLRDVELSDFRFAGV